MSSIIPRSLPLSGGGSLSFVVGKVPIFASLEVVLAPGSPRPFLRYCMREMRPNRLYNSTSRSFFRRRRRSGFRFFPPLNNRGEVTMSFYASHTIASSPEMPLRSRHHPPPPFSHTLFGPQQPTKGASIGVRRVRFDGFFFRTCSSLSQARSLARCPFSETGPKGTDSS